MFSFVILLLVHITFEIINRHIAQNIDKDTHFEFTKKKLHQNKQFPHMFWLLRGTPWIESDSCNIPVSI